MKVIKNETNQGFEIYLNTNNGPTAIWIKPKQKVVVDESALSEQILVFVKRKLLKLINA